MWFVYLLECADQSLYTGITTDLERRVDEHNGSKLGARYTRSRRPVRLLYHERYDDRSSATQREIQIKRFSRKEKIQLTLNRE
ncbi:MAG: GIY-YIG nuclease family protein [Gammaproteobacteria bacterium]|nr:GIY-YIG nuclease family protein [Gammaproteobacteria bacterium]